MLKVEDKLIIQMNEEMNGHTHSLLTMLYLPLIKERAFVLYNLLVALCKGKATFANHLIIQRLSGYTIELIEKERMVLEKFLLLKTYYDAKENQYLYIVLAPKSGEEFLKHELFGRMYLNQLGEQVTKFQKINFTSNTINRDSYEDISNSISNILKDDWNEEFEETYLKIKDDIDKSNEQIKIAFNYDEFLNGYSDLVWPKKKRTKENLKHIGEIATVYGISPKAMKILVSRSLDKDSNLNIELLTQKAIASKAKFETNEVNTYKWPPTRFLQSKQSGIPVSKNDQEIIRVLLEEYRMSPEVCNVLIEYVLDSSDQKLIRNYVESIAASWSRAKIDTYEKAIERVSGPVSQTVVKMDKKEQEETTLSEEDRLKLIEKINQLKGK